LIDLLHYPPQQKNKKQPSLKETVVPELWVLLEIVLKLFGAEAKPTEKTNAPAAKPTTSPSDQNSVPVTQQAKQ
jgi:hypothetical protein